MKKDNRYNIKNSTYSVCNINCVVDSDPNMSPFQSIYKLFILFNKAICLPSVTIFINVLLSQLNGTLLMF